MSNLRTHFADREALTLDELVNEANELLPTYLPSGAGSARVKSDVNPRLVRHYTSEGLLDEPLKEGREARYEYRHLLQLLIVRRLLAEGFSATAIGNLARKKSTPELEELLEGGVQLEVKPQTPIARDAVDFLLSIRQGSPAPSSPAPTPPSPRSQPTPQLIQESSWDRYVLMEGLELHVRSDF